MLPLIRREGRWPDELLEFLDHRSFPFGSIECWRGYHRYLLAIVRAMDFDRPVLRSVDVELGDHVAVSVVLEAEGKEHHGRAEGAADRALRPRVVGEATLRALESVTGSARFELSAVGTSTIDGVTIALVQVAEPGRPDVYVGSALIRRGDTVLATARAVLDALNRRLTLIL